MKLHRIVSLTCTFLAFAGCKSAELEPRTEVLLQIDAERLVKLSADHMTVEIASGATGGALAAAAPEEFDLATDEFNWPASIALLAKPGHENHIFDVSIHIEANGKRLARSRVKSSFIRHQTLLLKTLLYGECLGFTECSDAQTCVAPTGKARCDSADVDPNTLPQYNTDAAAGQSAAQSGAGAGAATGASGMSGGAGRGGRGAGVSGSQDAGAQDAAMPVGGGPAGCQKTGAEQCDNSLDDDCNGDIDCADAACTNRQCVPGGMLMGVLVPESSACPSGFEKGEQLLHRGLVDAGCGGCTCQPVQTSCTPKAYFYGTSTECTSDVPPFHAGTLVTSPIPEQSGCSSTPAGASIGMSTPAGWRVQVTQSPAMCEVNGAARPLTPTWSTTMKLCVTAGQRNGCEPGFACVPKVSSGQLCTKREMAECPAPTSLQIWQSDYVDERSCGSCRCAAEGGSCSGLRVSLARSSTVGGTGGTGGFGGTGGLVGASGTGATGATLAVGGSGGTTTLPPMGGSGGTTTLAPLGGCNIVDSTLGDGQKACLLTTYAPAAFHVVTPVNPTCSASAPVSGSLRPSTPVELCCLN